MNPEEKRNLLEQKQECLNKDPYKETELKSERMSAACASTAGNSGTIAIDLDADNIIVPISSGLEKRLPC